MSARSLFLAIPFALVLGLGAAPAARAQTLLDDLLPQTGVCTCAKMQPPNDCKAALAEPQERAKQIRGEFRAQCAKDWRAGCEKQYGWQACASADANRQLAAQCDAAVEQWYREVAAPQISQMSKDCEAANAPWIKQCETVGRQKSCQQCDDMKNDIAKLEKEIAEGRRWLESMRNGDALITAETEQQMSQRTDEVSRWERELAEKRDGFAAMQDSDFCPRDAGAPKSSPRPRA